MTYDNISVFLIVSFRYTIKYLILLAISSFAIFTLTSCTNVQTGINDEIEQLIDGHLYVNQFAIPIIKHGNEWNFDLVPYGAPYMDTLIKELPCYCPCKCEDYYQGKYYWGRCLTLKDMENDKHTNY